MEKITSLMAVMLYLGNTAYAEEQLDIIPMSDGYPHVQGGQSGKEASLKTIYALLFVASVLYILLILLKFT